MFIWVFRVAEFDGGCERNLAINKPKPCRPLRGLDQSSCTDPGAYAPGFMLSRTPRAISNQVGFYLGYGFAGLFKISASALSRFASAAFFALGASFSNAGAIFFRFPVSPF